MKNKELKKERMQDKVKMLQNILDEDEFTPPLFVRFKRNEGSLMLAINKIITDENGLSINNGKASTVQFLNWDEINSIEAFCDSKRKPVFLNGFAEAGEIEITKEINY